MKQTEFKPPELLLGETPAHYLERNWDVIAPNAYLNYKLEGRGTIVYDFSGTAPFPHSYFREKTLAGRSDPLFARLLEVVRSYNPEEEVVLLITTPQKRVGACIVKTPKDHDSPPDLYKGLMKKLKKQSN